MIKYLHYLVIVLFLFFLFGCNSTAKRQAEKEKKQAAAPTRRMAPEVQALYPRGISSVFSGQGSHAAGFNYQTTVQNTMGDYVQAPMSEIVRRNTGLHNELDDQVNIHQQPEFTESLSSHLLRLTFDNDIFDNTDYYYTNGVRIEFTMPLAAHTPVNRILAGSKKADVHFSGFSITQNIYTPINPETTAMEYGDRPFAGYLTIGQLRESYLLQSRIFIKSKLDLGVLGPASLGETVQTTVHYLEPVGWQYQISNSFVINYYLHVEKGLISSPNIELNAVGEANLGTLYDNIGAGLNVRVGSFMPVFRGPVTVWNNPAGKHEFQYWFFLSGQAGLVGWDATLQGSLFNQSSPYVIPGSDVSRMVYRASAGVAVYYQRFGVDLENVFLSPEFTGARSFKYGRIRLTVNF